MAKKAAVKKSVKRATIGAGGKMHEKKSSGEIVFNLEHVKTCTQVEKFQSPAGNVAALDNPVTLLYVAREAMEDAGIDPTAGVEIVIRQRE